MNRSSSPALRTMNPLVNNLAAHAKAAKTVPMTITMITASSDACPEIAMARMDSSFRQEQSVGENSAPWVASRSRWQEVKRAINRADRAQTCEPGFWEPYTRMLPGLAATALLGCVWGGAAWMVDGGGPLRVANGAVELLCTE